MISRTAYALVADIAQDYAASGAHGYTMTEELAEELLSNELRRAPLPDEVSAFRHEYEIRRAQRAN